MDHPFWSVDEENTISRWRIQEIKQAWPVSKTGEAGFFYFFIKEWIAPLHSARRSDKKTYINCLIWSLDGEITAFGGFFALDSQKLS